MRRANGTGHITKLSGNRRRPYAVRKIVGWTEKGTPKYKYISYHKTEREAERALNSYTEDPYRLGKYTLEDVYKEWYAIKETEKQENTLRGYRTQWNHLKPLYETKIQNLDRFELQKYFNSLELTEYALVRIRNLLKMLFQYAVKRGVLPISALNLTKAIDLCPKVETKENGHILITKEEISELWKQKDDETVKIILFYIYTGLRFSELRSLIAKNIHGDYIEITQAKTEAGKRIVPLSDKAKSLLPIRDVPPHTTFCTHMQKVLPGHTPHDTRHTFISLMVEAKIDDRIIKAIVGHKPTDITEHYTHISFEVMQEAVNQI